MSARAARQAPGRRLGRLGGLLLLTTTTVPARLPPPLACLDVTDACERGCRVDGAPARVDTCMAACAMLFERCLAQRQDGE